jgi:hypothetical protein
MYHTVGTLDTVHLKSASHVQVTECNHAESGYVRALQLLTFMPFHSVLFCVNHINSWFADL